MLDSSSIETWKIEDQSKLIFALWLKYQTACAEWTKAEETIMQITENLLPEPLSLWSLLGISHCQWKVIDDSASSLRGF